MEHYAALDTSNLLEFIDNEGSNRAPKVSLYFSVPHASDFAMFGKSEFRSLIQRAARRMTFSGASLQSRLEVEVALNDLVTNSSLWENRVDGYAIFASNDTVRCYGLPQEMHRLVIVSDQFYIRPLVSLLTTPHSFYVLEVSLGNVRLVKVMPQLLVEVPLGTLPHDRAGFEGHSEPVHDRNFHSSHMAHGIDAIVPHGSHEDAKHAQGKRYLQHAAHLVDQQLAGEHTPVILIGTESARGHFMRHIQYKNVINNSHDVHVPETMSVAARDASGIWQRCASIAKEWEAHTSTEDAITDYYALEGVGRATSNTFEIQQFASTGKINTLLLGDSLTLDGVLTADQYYENAAIIDTLRHGGKVIEADISRFHHHTGAILRSGAYTGMFEEHDDHILTI